MRKSIILTLLAAGLGLSSGCSASRSPVSLPPTSNRTGFGEAATIGVATVAGAAAGHAIRDDALGAAIGAGAGLVTGALVNNVIASNRDQREAELVDAARRAERAKIQQEYWEAERIEKSGGLRDSTSIANRTVTYQGGYFEGVNVAPRQGGGASSLDEPKRQ